MTPEQRERLTALSVKIADVVLLDVDPDNWTGAGIALKDMTKAERGDAAWCRKTAIQSASLLTTIERLRQEPGARPPAPEDDPDDAIERAERAAAEALKRIGLGTK